MFVVSHVHVIRGKEEHMKINFLDTLAINVLSLNIIFRFECVLIWPRKREF